MNRVAVAKEMMKLAKELTAKEDTAEDIATDVVSRLSTGMDVAKAFKEVGHADLWKHTRATEIPDDFDSLDKDGRVKVLTRAIEKALKRQKTGSTAMNRVAKDESAMRIVEILKQERGQDFKANWTGAWDRNKSANARVVTINRGAGFESAVAVDAGYGMMIYMGPFSIVSMPTSSEMFLFNCDSAFFIRGF